MELACGVCNMGYSSEDGAHVPRNLVCGHTFCSTCLSRFAREGYIPCPFRCQISTPLPPNGVDGLARSFGILDVLKSRHNQMMSSSANGNNNNNNNGNFNNYYGTNSSLNPNNNNNNFNTFNNNNNNLYPQQQQQQQQHRPPPVMNTYNSSSLPHDSFYSPSAAAASSSHRPPPFNPAAAAAAAGGGGGGAGGGGEGISPYSMSSPYSRLGGGGGGVLPGGGGVGGGALPYPVAPVYQAPPPQPNRMGSGNSLLSGMGGGVGGGVGGMLSSSGMNSLANRLASFKVIEDKYSSLNEVQRALRHAGLESSNLVIAIDYTKSNTWTGEKTFGGKSLHFIDPSGRFMNPYQSVCSVIGRTLQAFDDDNLIPAFGFGDRSTCDKTCFPFFPDGKLCIGVEGVLQRYNEITPQVVLAGPTNFAPVIREAIKIVAETRSYHILLIIADGQVTSKRDTENAIVEASRYPMSIIVVGVGDGPWEVMEEFDDGLPERQFDNFQFVQYHSILQANPGASFDAAFATAALMEIPEQYQAIRDLGLLEQDS